MFGHALIDSRRVVRDAGILPGMHVADFGCGRSGHFILPLRHAIGAHGQVYAVDLVKDHLAGLENLCAMHGMTNVTSVWGDFEREGGVSIPSETLDAIFLVNTLPRMTNVEDFAGEVERLLKGDGRLFVIDWKRRVPHPVAPEMHRRMEMADAEALLARYGWRKTDEVPVSGTHWGAQFQLD